MISGAEMCKSYHYLFTLCTIMKQHHEGFMKKDFLFLFAKIYTTAKLSCLERHRISGSAFLTLSGRYKIEFLGKKAKTQL